MLNARRTILFTLAVLALAPSAAMARGGADDPAGDDNGGDRTTAPAVVRVSGTCGRGATSKLKLKRDDGRIETEFEVDDNRAGRSWRVVISHDGRVAYRGTRRTAGRSGSFSVERRLGDLAGADRITARATGPGGITCTAVATLRG